MEENLIKEQFCESIRSSIICVDGDMIWCIDDAVNGLYQIDRFTYKVRNVLSPSQLFKYGRMRIATIFNWEEKIILVPEKLECYWIVYNKITKETCYRKITNIEGKTIGGRVVGCCLFLAPRSIDDQAVIINLRTFCCVGKINICKEKVQDKSAHKVWDVAATDTGIIFTFYDTKYIIRINPEDFKTYIMHIPYGICSLSFCGNELWILPSQGREIYLADMNGEIKDRICFTDEDCFTDASDFARIVATENYIFLLPFSMKGIYTYLKKEKRIVIIKTGKKRLSNAFSKIDNTSSYWEYYIHKNNIFFFPLENPFLIVDLDTLEWKEVDIYLPSVFSGHNLKFWSDYNQMLNEYNIAREYKTNMKELFSEYFETFEKDDINLNQNTGEIIWKQIISSF